MQVAGVGPRNVLITNLAPQLERIINRNTEVYGNDISKWPKSDGYRGYDNNSGESSGGTERREGQENLFAINQNNTPQDVINVRKLKVYRELNKKLREILRERGIDAVSVPNLKRMHQYLNERLDLLKKSIDENEDIE